jgi:hypothetical protein
MHPAAFGAGFRARAQAAGVAAPVPCPPVVSSWLVAEKSDLYQAQFRDPTVQFVASEAISAENVADALAVVRHHLGWCYEVYDVTPQRYHLLADAVWVVPDVRKLPAVGSSDPVAAQVPHLGSMLLFQLQVTSRLITEPLSADNLAWSAVLLANKLHQGEGRDAVAVPPRIQLTYEQVLQGLVPFPSFREVFPDVVFPANAVFFEPSDSGVPVSPLSVRALAARFIPPTARLQDNPEDLAAKEHARLAKEARIKQAQRDFESMERFKGMYGEREFAALFGAEHPCMSGARDTLDELMSSCLQEFAPTESQVSKFLQGQFGSLDGTAQSGRLSFTFVAPPHFQPASDWGDFSVTYRRFQTLCGRVFGPHAEAALQALSHVLTEALASPSADPTDAAIGLPGAIDIVNRCLYRIAHDDALRGLSRDERWTPVVSSVSTSTVWLGAVRRQREASHASQAKRALTALVDASPHLFRSGKRDAPDGGKGGRGSGPAKRVRKERRASAPGRGKGGSPSEATGLDSRKGGAPKAVDGQTPTPPRCRHQDAADGCPYGLACSFTHDAAHPKTDATKRSAGGGRS